MKRGALHHRNRVLQWRLTDRSYEALFANEEFGYFDIRHLVHLRDVTALTLFGEIGLVRGMRRPELRIHVEGLHGRSGQAGPACWKTTRRPCLSGLATIAALHKLRLVVGLAWRHRLAGIDTLELRIEHAATTWTSAALGKSDGHFQKVIVIEPGGMRRMRPDALPAHLRGRARMPV